MGAPAFAAALPRQSNHDDFPVLHCRSRFDASLNASHSARAPIPASADTMPKSIPYSASDTASPATRLPLVTPHSAELRTVVDPLLVSRAR